MEEKAKREYFTRISSRTLENLAKLKITPNEWRTMMALVRKTYGYQKTKDKISLSQFQSLTGLERKRQVMALKSLVRKGIILKETGYINSYSVNKEYAEWLVAVPPPGMTSKEADKLVALRSELVAPEGQLPVAGPPHTIDNTKYILQGSEEYKNFVLEDIALSNARYERENIMDDTASALPASAEPVAGKRLRSFEEIRREHPEARRIAMELPGSHFFAVWKNLPTDEGFNSEICL